MTAKFCKTSTADLTLEHLYALRREVKVLLDARLETAGDFEGVNLRLDRIEHDLRRVQADVAHLDMKDISRQDEILTILRKLAHIHEDGPTPADFVPE